MLRCFFSADDPNVESVVSLDSPARSHLSLPGPLLLLSSPAPCSPTSLVWSFAASLCAEGRHVALLGERPRLSRVASPSPGLSSLSLFYADSSPRRALLALLSLHLRPPSALLLDFSWPLLLTGLSPLEAARTTGLLIATLLDTVRFLRAAQPDFVCLVAAAPDDVAHRLLRAAGAAVLQMSAPNGGGEFRLLTTEESPARIKFSPEGKALAVVLM